MAKILPVTPTLLNTFLTCPKQYEARYITHEVEFKQTEQALYGIMIHKSVEEALKENKPLRQEAQYMERMVRWCQHLAAQPGVTMYVEKSLAITRNFTPTNWRNSEVWMRGKADVFFKLERQRMNLLIDWKTGKPKHDWVQAHILSLCARSFSGYSKTVCLWNHVRHDEVLPAKFDLIDLTPVEPTLADVARYERACKSDSFPPTRNGLCNAWCDVISCPFNGKHQQR